MTDDPRLKNQGVPEGEEGDQPTEDEEEEEADQPIDEEDES